MKFSGLPAERVIGSGTVLDTARLRTRIADILNVNAKSVHAHQIGEHGDTELTLWSLADVGGQKVTDLLPANVRSDISEFVCNEAYDIIEKKGATYYGIATCIENLLSILCRNASINLNQTVVALLINLFTQSSHLIE